MKLSESLQKTAKEALTKEDRIALSEMTGIIISGIYNALRGERDLTPTQYDIIQKYLLNKAKNG